MGEQLKKLADAGKTSAKKVTDLKHSDIINEFKEFINRGNVVDMAVGVVVGGAFSTIVTSLVNDIVMPVVSLLIGGVDFTHLEITIPNIFGGRTAAHIAYGNFIQNVVNFLIIAFCVFLAVRLINSAKRRAESLKKDTAAAVKEAAKVEQKTDEEMLEILKDIREELKKNNKK